MSNPGDSLHEALVRAADHSSPCARVLRYHEGRQVATRPRDFYVALKRVDPLVVRLNNDQPGESLLPLDCRHQNGAVEFTHEHRETGVTGRDEFVDDIREAESVELIPHRESQFASDHDGDESVDADVDDSEVRADGGRSTADAIFDAIDQHATDNDGEGAPAGRVLDTVLDDTDHGLGNVCAVLSELHHTGQIYRPAATRIKPTNIATSGDEDGGRGA